MGCTSAKEKPFKQEYLCGKEVQIQNAEHQNQSFASAKKNGFSQEQVKSENRSELK